MSHIKFTRKTQFLSKETKNKLKTSPMIHTKLIEKHCVPAKQTWNRKLQNRISKNI